MAKFMCTHTLPPGQLTKGQLEQFAQAAQQDPAVKGYRSFVNLAEGKAVCVMEASNKEAVVGWFNPPSESRVVTSPLAGRLFPRLQQHPRPEVQPRSCARDSSLVRQGLQLLHPPAAPDR